MCEVISILGLLAALALLFLPFFLLLRLHTTLLPRAVRGVGALLAQFVMVGVYLHVLQQVDSPWLNLIWVVTMVTLMAVLSLKQTRVKGRVLLLPMVISMLCAVLAVTLVVWLLVLAMQVPPLQTRWFVPVAGMMMGSVFPVCTAGVNEYFERLHADQQTYYYMVGNGASEFQALLPFIRLAIEKSFSPLLAQVTWVGFATLPGFLLGTMLGGLTALEAVWWQLVAVAATFCASTLSLVASIWFSRRYTFSSGGQLLDVFRKG